MLGGTGFLLYKNHSITARKSNQPVITTPPELNKFSQLKLADVSSATDKEGSGASATSTKTAVSTDKNKKAKGALDISILDDDKFRSLKENIVPKQQPVNVGRKNPFEPF